MVETYANEYLFLSCIKYINQVKSGPFAEHSNQLWGISGVSTWSKVNSGLIKMYKVEVLGKFPVVQHILFGSLLSFKLAETGAGEKRSSATPPPKLPTQVRSAPVVGKAAQDDIVTKEKDEISGSQQS